jgi:hypothetical protein
MVTKTRKPKYPHRFRAFNFKGTDADFKAILRLKTKINCISLADGVRQALALASRGRGKLHFEREQDRVLTHSIILRFRPGDLILLAALQDRLRRDGEVVSKTDVIRYAIRAID